MSDKDNLKGATWSEFAKIKRLIQFAENNEIESFKELIKDIDLDKGVHFSLIDFLYSKERVERMLDACSLDEDDVEFDETVGFFVVFTENIDAIKITLSELESRGSLFYPNDCLNLVIESAISVKNEEMLDFALNEAKQKDILEELDFYEFINISIESGNVQIFEKLIKALPLMQGHKASISFQINRIEDGEKRKNFREVAEVNNIKKWSPQNHPMNYSQRVFEQKTKIKEESYSPSNKI